MGEEDYFRMHRWMEGEKEGERERENDGKKRECSNWRKRGEASIPLRERGVGVKERTLSHLQ